MTKEDIIRMARDVWLTDIGAKTLLKGLDVEINIKELERFVSIVASVERDAWRNVAIRIGENLATNGPDNYYDFTSDQWLDWALKATEKMQADYMQFGSCGEREACAKVCEEQKGPHKSYGLIIAKKCAEAIRARGQA